MIELRKIKRIEKTYQHYKRFEEIIKTLFKYGLQDMIDGIDLPAPMKAVVHKVFEDNLKKMEGLSRAKRVRKALEELGPTFIKLGQILSLRIDWLPVDVIDELTHLQDEVPPFSLEEAKEIMREEWGQSYEEIFTELVPTPIGSASLGQVYKAKFKQGGLPVAIKVQRPDIQNIIEIDLEILFVLTRFFEEKIKEFQYYRPTEILEEFTKSIAVELDYKYEEAHIERFGKIFSEDGTVHIMKVYPEHSTRKVLVMELIEGISARHINKLKEAQLDLKLIAQRGVESVLRQIFREGFFHADPHPGNIFIENNNVIAFIDFGMVGRLSQRSRIQMADFLFAVVKRDEAKAAEQLLNICHYENETDSKQLQKDLGELIDRYVDRPLRQISLSRLFFELGTLLAMHRMTLYADFSMMFKTIATLEGLGRSMDPKINLTDKMIPHFQRIQLERLSPLKISDDLAEVASRFIKLFKDTPVEIRNLLSSFKQGKSKIVVEHQADKEFKTFVNQGINRLSYALLISALIVASSIMILSQIPPKWYDIPLIGLIGFIVAGIMGLRLLLSIWKHGMF